MAQPYPTILLCAFAALRFNVIQAHAVPAPESRHPRASSAPLGGGDGSPVISTTNGIVIGRNNEGLADEGDALFHIASFDNAGNVEDQIRQSNQDLPDMHEEEDGQPVRYHPFAD